LKGKLFENKLVVSLDRPKRAASLQQLVDEGGNNVAYEFCLAMEEFQ
jgi:hypothetical protein